MHRGLDLFCHYATPVTEETIEQLIWILRNEGISIEGNPQIFEEECKAGNRTSLQLGEPFHVIEYDPEIETRLTLSSETHLPERVLTHLQLGVTLADETECQFVTTDDQKELDPLSVGAVTVYGNKMASRVGEDRLRTAPALAIHERDGGIGLVVGHSRDPAQKGSVESYLDEPANTEDTREPIVLDAVPDQSIEDEIGILTALGEWIRDDVEKEIHASERRYETLLDDGDDTVRAEAYWAYGHQYRNADPERAEAVLERIVADGFTDSSPRVRAAAAESVGMIIDGDSDRKIDEHQCAAVKRIAFEDESAAVRTAAARALSEYGASHVPYDELRDWFRDVLKTEDAAGPQTEALLLIGSTGDDLSCVFERLDADEPEVRGAAASTLNSRALRYESIGDPTFEAEARKHEDTIRNAVSHPDERVQNFAIDALGALDEEDVSGLINELLNGESPEKQKSAARALTGHPKPEVVDALIEALSDPAELVREWAVRSLHTIAQEDPEVAESAVEPLCERVDDLPNPDVVGKALGEVGDERALDTLLSLVEEGVSGSERAIGSLGSAAVDPLIERLESARDWDSNRQPKRTRRMVRALSYTGDSQAFAPLVKELSHHSNRYTRHALGRLEDPRAVPVLIEELRDDQKVRRVFDESGTWNGMSAAPDLREVYYSDEEPRHARRRAAATLACLADPDSFQPILKELDTDDYKTRRGIVQEIWMYKDERLEPVLRWLADNDPHKNIRQVAEERHRWLLKELQSNT